MENYTYMSMLTGYKDRVSRIALFDIFATLESKQLKDKKNKPIDFFGLGLLSLLFFFESMLLRVKRRGIHELASYLKEITEGELYDSDEDYNILAKMIIETFRPTKGRRNHREFYNYETKEKELVDIAILKADDWDTVKNLQYYTLDEQGLELIFATKEYFSEFQISISQMMLRKQLEKGEFFGALRQVDEMRISVNTIKDNIYRIKHDIQRNITSEDTYNRYKELISDINSRLMNEQGEFVELSNFIKETKGYLDTPTGLDEKDQKALELLVRIDNELGHVHYLHSTLLHESIELKNTALEAASESLYYAGITSFNFDTELARKITSVPIPLEETKVLVKPYLKLNTFETWSPLAVFAPQVRDISNQDKHNLIFIDVNEQVDKEIYTRKQSMATVLKLINQVMYLNNNQMITMSDLVNREELKPYIDTREFCEAMVILHQMSPISVKEILDLDEHLFHQGIKEYFSEAEFIYTKELTDIIQTGEHYKIRDMKLWIGGEDERSNYNKNI